jgi:sugar lactone lactonase YvrE
MTPSLNRRDLLACAGLTSIATLVGLRPARAAYSQNPSAVTVAAPVPGAPTSGAALELVAAFSGPRQVTGVAVSAKGRIFVNFPRWEEDVALSVAEVGPDGKLTPYPDAAWNAFRDADPTAARPSAAFVCVQSVTVDRQDRLWVLDPAAPGLGFEVTGGPKLVCIDLATDTVVRTYHFGPDIAPQGSYLNDIRFTADGKRAVMTNSGAPGCLVAFDVATGQAHRVLDGDPSTQFDTSVTIDVDGKPLVKLDGEPAHFSADGIMLDDGDRTVLWQATTGKTMYKVPLAALFDRSLSPKALSAKVAVAAHTFVTDGYWHSPRSGRLVTDPAAYAVKRFDPDGGFTILTQDPRLFWPDSMAEGPDGAIYVTASHIPGMKTWQGPGIAQTQLFRFHPK